MDNFRKKVLIDVILGLVIAVFAAFMVDLFHAQTLRDVFRLLSDSFFLPAAMLLGSAGLSWAKNGGVWDGLGFTVKVMFARMKRDYDKNRITFAEYKRQREEKNASPVSSLIAGLVYLALAVVFLVLFNMSS